MLKLILRTIYYLLVGVLYPFDKIWRWYFRQNVNLKDVEKIVITGMIGGEGKSTMSIFLYKKLGYHHIRIDDCKYGENWRRYTNEEFKKHVNEQLCDKYVVDGAHNDPKLSAQQEIMNDLMDKADLVIWNYLPKWVAIWRKAFRSVKRYIGVVPQGSAIETWTNVSCMLKKSYETFDSKHKILDEVWNQKTNGTNGMSGNMNRNKYVKADWPFFVDM